MSDTEWGGRQVATMLSGVLLVAIIDGEYFSVSQDNPNFEAAKQALRDKDIDALIAAVKPIVAVERAISKYGRVTVEADEVLVNGKPVHGVLVDRILEFARDGIDITGLCMFLDNLYDNPSKSAVDELYLFLESAKTPMPITEDGHFLAYKKVRDNFHDLYSNTVDYSVGNIVEMPRNAVNDDRSVTCAEGLHFCSLDYLPNFHSGNYPVIIVKINPRDVVSIPNDYNNSKGRASRMEVIGIHKGGQNEPAWTKGYTTTAENRTVVTTHGESDYDDGDLIYFVTRKQARDYVWANGGRVIDGQKEPLPQEAKGRRWAVYRS